MMCRVDLQLEDRETFRRRKGETSFVKIRAVSSMFVAYNGSNVHTSVLV